MMRVGQYIRIKHNIHNYPDRDGNNWKYFYYQLVNGPFEIADDNFLHKFDGKHFVCVGSDYWHGTSGAIMGLQLLEEEHEVVKGIPKDLFK